LWKYIAKEKKTFLEIAELMLKVLFTKKWNSC